MRPGDDEAEDAVGDQLGQGVKFTPNGLSFSHAQGEKRRQVRGAKPTESNCFLPRAAHNISKRGNERAQV